MPRPLSARKRVGLEGIEDNWTSECYADIRPATYDEYLEWKSLNIKDKTEAEWAKYEIDFVKKHLIGGKVFVLNDQNEDELDDLVSEHIEASRALADRLFLSIVGVIVDPKGSSTATETSPTNKVSTEPSKSTSNTKQF